MKRIFLLLFLALVVSSQHIKAADVTVVIDGITYALNKTADNVDEWNKWVSRYENSASVTKIDASLTEVSIPRSIEYEGTKYMVAVFDAYVRTANLKLSSIEFQDGVEIYLHSYSSINSTSYPILVTKFVIGKNVRIVTRRSFLLKINEVYCNDEIPMGLYLMSRSTANSVDGFETIRFGDNMTTKVYVPKGAEKAYKTSFGWSEYWNIIGTEALGDVTENNVTSASFNFNQKSAIIDTHTVTALPIAIDNKNELSAIEFDVVLPANVETQGENPITGSERGTEMSFSTTANEDGSLHVVATATTALAAGKGNIATIAVQTAKSDNYVINLNNVKVTTKTGKVISLDNEALQFVANHKKGDYNEDGDVDVVDAQSLLNYVLGI